MAIEDFLKEAHKRTGGAKLSPVQQEVHEFARMIYFDIKNGDTHRWVEEASKILIDSIAPNLSSMDARKAATCIQGIALTVLSDLLSSGTLIKKGDYKNETREQS